MEKNDLIMLVFFSVVAVIGLILVVLQKKGLSKPVVTQTTSGFKITSGGTIILLAVVLGAKMLYEYSVWAAGLYVAVFLVGYVLIQIVFRK